MAQKEFVVFGLGRFGRSVATTLAERNCEVLVVDNNSDNIHEMADIVTHAVQIDVTDPEAMASLGISNFDGAIVAIGENLEASVMVTILAKEMGVPYVLAKAQSELHAKVLKKVGADLVVFPEKETGIRIANKLLMDNFFNSVELSSLYSLMELNVHEKWSGQTLKDLNLRVKYKINVIGIKHGDQLDINPDAEAIISKDDILVVIGLNEVLNKLATIH